MSFYRSFGVFLFCIFYWIPLHAEGWCCTGYDIECRASVFLPISQEVRDIFDDVLPYYEVEASMEICTCWQIFCNVGYLYAGGHALGCKHKTNIHLVPMTLGAKYFWSTSSCFDFYAGGGVSWCFFKENDHSQYVQKTLTDQNVGGTLELGCVYQLSERFFVDFCAAYLFQYFSPKRHHKEQDDNYHYTVKNEVNLSGAKIGVGIGYSF